MRRKSTTINAPQCRNKSMNLLRTDSNFKQMRICTIISATVELTEWASGVQITQSPRCSGCSQRFEVILTQARISWWAIASSGGQTNPSGCVRVSICTTSCRGNQRASSNSSLSTWNKSVDLLNSWSRNLVVWKRAHGAVQSESVKFGGGSSCFVSSHFYAIRSGKCETADHQRTGQRPRLTRVIFDAINFDAALFVHFTAASGFNRFTW